MDKTVRHHSVPAQGGGGSSGRYQGFMDQVHPQDMDWGFVAANIDQWVEKCELEFLQ